MSEGSSAAPSTKRSLKTASISPEAEVLTYKRRRTDASGDLVEVEVEFPPSFVVAHPDIFLKLHENLGK